MLHNPTFWVAVSFFGFLALLAYLKVPAMLGRSLDARADAIRKELDQARRLREEAQDLLADYQMKQRQAEEEAKAIVAEAQCEAAAAKIEAERSLKESIERRARLADEKIARAEAQAVAEVRAAAVERAVAAAQSVLAKRAGGPLGGTLVDESIRDLKGKLN